MFLISEELDQNNYQFLTESKTGSFYLQGIFGEAELVNKNKRKYPITEMEKAVHLIQDKLKSHQKVLGEWTHPKRLTVDPMEACIRIDELKMDGNKMIGKAKVLDGLPKGELLKGLLQNDILMPVSTRGTGKLVKNPDFFLVENFNLITVDVVSDPSCPTATPDLVMENVNWLHDIGVLTDVEAELLETVQQTQSADEVKQIHRDLFQSLFNDVENNFKNYLLNILKK